MIPTNWVDEVSQVQVQGFAGDYSYYFWHRTLDGVDYLSADGDGGQYINIFPEENMVIVMTMGLYGQWPLYVNQANEMMEDYILLPFSTCTTQFQTILPNLVLSWPTDLTNYDLFSTTSLTPAATWQPVTNAPTPQGDHWQITLPMHDPAVYFQLQSP